MAMREFLGLGGPGEDDDDNSVAGDSDNDGGSEYTDVETSTHDDGDIRPSDDD